MQGFIVLSCLIAVFVNFSTFLVIGKTSPVTYQVLGHLKTCLVLAFGYTLLHDPFTSRNILGILIAVVGMGLYSYFCTNETKRKQVLDVSSLPPVTTTIFNVCTRHLKSWCQLNLCVCVCLSLSQMKDKDANSPLLASHQEKESKDSAVWSCWWGGFHGLISEEIFVLWIFCNGTLKPILFWFFHEMSSLVRKPFFSPFLADQIMRDVACCIMYGQNNRIQSEKYLIFYKYFDLM